jgi:hypothetical protein
MPINAMLAAGGYLLQRVTGTEVDAGGDPAELQQQEHRCEQHELQCRSRVPRLAEAETRSPRGNSGE